jgi:hypothetical protein
MADQVADCLIQIRGGAKNASALWVRAVDGFLALDDVQKKMVWIVCLERLVVSPPPMPKGAQVGAVEWMGVCRDQMYWLNKHLARLDYEDGVVVPGVAAEGIGRRGGSVVHHDDGDDLAIHDPDVYTDGRPIPSPLSAEEYTKKQLAYVEALRKAADEEDNGDGAADGERRKGGDSSYVKARKIIQDDRLAREEKEKKEREERAARPPRPPRPLPAPRPRIDFGDLPQSPDFDPARWVRLRVDSRLQKDERGDTPQKKWLPQMLLFFFQRARLESNKQGFAKIRDRYMKKYNKTTEDFLWFFSTHGGEYYVKVATMEVLFDGQWEGLNAADRRTLETYRDVVLTSANAKECSATIFLLLFERHIDSIRDYLGTPAVAESYFKSYQHFTRCNLYLNPPNPEPAANFRLWPFLPVNSPLFGKHDGSLNELDDAFMSVINHKISQRVASQTQPLKGTFDSSHGAYSGEDDENNNDSEEEENLFSNLTLANE